MNRLVTAGVVAALSFQLAATAKGAEPTLIPLLFESAMNSSQHVNPIRRRTLHAR
jgi:hypothetical protein